MSAVPAVIQQRPSLVSKFAQKYTIEPEKLLPILKATAFKVKDGEVTNEQMAALLVVADQYGLNPFTREIFAFPDKGGIVPVVGVDGWSRIINDHPAFDGMDFVQDDNSCTCIIYRKDRAHPIKVTEYMAECKRGTSPWQSHPRRMLRHKALIQCARVAFSFAGIYDEDEAERIIERDITPQQPAERSASASLKAAVIGKPAGVEDVADTSHAAAPVETEAVSSSLHTVIDHIAALDSLDSAEEISAYAEKLAPEILSDERWPRAVKKRLDAIKAKK